MNIIAPVFDPRAQITPEVEIAAAEAMRATVRHEGHVKRMPSMAVKPIAPDPSIKFNRNAPIKIRGVTYRNVFHAADALGCSVHAIYSARRKGRLDFCGTQPFRHGGRAKE